MQGFNLGLLPNPGVLVVLAHASSARWGEGQGGRGVLEASPVVELFHNRARNGSILLNFATLPGPSPQGHFGRKFSCVHGIG